MFNTIFVFKTIFIFYGLRIFHFEAVYLLNFGLICTCDWNLVLVFESEYAGINCTSQAPIKMSVRGFQIAMFKLACL